MACIFQAQNENPNMLIFCNRADLILKNFCRSKEKFPFDMDNRDLVVLPFLFRVEFRKCTRIGKSVFNQMRHRSFPKKENKRNADPDINRRIESQKKGCKES